MFAARTYFFNPSVFALTFRTSFSTTVSMPEVISSGNTLCSCSTNNGSFSTATTCAPVARSSRVSAPFPGPISRMVSPGWNLADSASFFAAQCPVRKCCPSRAPLFFLANFIIIVEKTSLLVPLLSPIMICKQPLINVGKEFRWQRPLAAAVFRPLMRIAQKKVLASACERNIKESTLFFGVASAGWRIVIAKRRKQSLFQTDDKNGIELQSLGRVYGHERYAPLIILHLELVLLPWEGGFLEKALYSRRRLIVFVFDGENRAPSRGSRS